MSTNNQLLLRQWTMLRAIPKLPRKISAKELMEKLENEGFRTTKRTIERDLQSISAIFPLVSDERNKPYGWSWAKDSPTFNLPGLTPSEALTFKLAEEYLDRLMPTSMLENLKPYFMAADKCLSDQDNAHSLVGWNKKVAIAHPGQALLSPIINNDLLIVIEDAILLNKQLEINYINTNDKESLLLTHPLGLVLRGQTTYMACTCFGYDDIRLLAVHRMQDAKIIDVESKCPDGFNLKAYASGYVSGLTEYGEIEVELKINKILAHLLLETWLAENQTIVALDNETFLLKVMIKDTDQFRWWLMGQGMNLEVKSPQYLRDLMAQNAKSANEIYND